MHNPPSTRKILFYQILTFGIYFLVWCYRLGKELSTALKQKAVPSMWWFILPGGAYYWMWRMTESLEIATGKRIKQVDTFLLYVVLSGAVLGGGLLFPNLPYNSHDIGSSPNSEAADINMRLIVTIMLVVITVFTLITIVLHGVFITIVQSKLNKIRGKV